MQPSSRRFDTGRREEEEKVGGHLVHVSTRYIQKDDWAEEEE